MAATVQVNEARLKASPMKIGAAKDAPDPADCIFSVQEEGSRMSNQPKRERASTTMSRKRNRFSPKLVAISCTFRNVPRRAPSTVKVSTMPPQKRTALRTVAARPPSCLEKNATVSGIKG